jgi:predicted N-acetyltransferase YhbS
MSVMRRLTSPGKNYVYLLLKDQKVIAKIKRRTTDNLIKKLKIIKGEEGKGNGEKLIDAVSIDLRKEGWNTIQVKCDQLDAPYYATLGFSPNIYWYKRGWYGIREEADYYKFL